MLIHLLNGDEFISKFLSSCQLYISFITQVELFASKKLTESESYTIEKLLEDCHVLHSSDRLSRLAASIRAQSGLKIPDAFVAATAIELGLPLVSTDKDFNRLDSLEFLHFKTS